MVVEAATAAATAAATVMAGGMAVGGDGGLHGRQSSGYFSCGGKQLIIPKYQKVGLRRSMQQANLFCMEAECRENQC